MCWLLQEFHLRHSLLSPFECLCGNFILPEPASYVFFYAFFNLRNLLYIIFYYIVEQHFEERAMVADLAEAGSGIE